MRKVLTNILICMLLAGHAQAADRRYTVSEADAFPELDCVIEPSEIVDVGSAVPGVLEAILADRSDVLQRGAVIARLESSVERATLALTKARAGLNTSIKLREQAAAFEHRSRQRNEALLAVQKSSISKQDMDRLKTESRIAQLQVRQERDNQRIAELEYYRAQAALNRGTIRSPVDGVVMERFKSVGEYVEDDPVVRMAKLHPLHVEAIVPVDFIGRIKPGMQATVTPTVPGSGSHVATVTRVDRVADAASGTFGALLSLDNPDYAIAGGLRCRLDFMFEAAEDLGSMAALPPAPSKSSENRPGGGLTNAKAPSAGTTLPSLRRAGAIDPIAAATRPEIAPTPDVAPGPEVAATPEVALGPEVASTPEFIAPVASTNSATTAGMATAVGYVATNELIAVSRPETAAACYSLGPVESETQARQLSAQLEAQTDGLALRNDTVNVVNGYFVLAAPEPNRPATRRLVVRLDKAGITDRYVMTRGDHKDRVSLGLYRSESSAAKRSRLLASKGFETEIVPRRKEVQRYWLDVALTDGNDLPARFQEIAVSLTPSASFEPVACSHQVAQR